MAWTQADLDAVREARRSGAVRVRFADREVTYRSDAELKALEQEIRAEIDTAAGKSKRTRLVRFTSSNGW